MPRGSARLDRARDRPDAGRHAQPTITFVVCNDAPTLVYLANLATIVLHVWTSRVPTLEEPDFVIFDLDPGRSAR